MNQTARQFKTEAEANTAIVSLGLQSAVAEYDELLEVWSVLLESGLLLTTSTVCTAEEQEEGLWGCECLECLKLQMEATLTRGEA